MLNPVLARRPLQISHQSVRLGEQNHPIRLNRPHRHRVRVRPSFRDVRANLRVRRVQLGDHLAILRLVVRFTPDQPRHLRLLQPRLRRARHERNDHLDRQQTRLVKKRARFGNVGRRKRPLQRMGGELRLPLRQRERVARSRIRAENEASFRQRKSIHVGERQQHQVADVGSIYT